MPPTIRRSDADGSDAPMHVLMLGWEFPPFITGGLGTACHGLTSALDDRGVRVTFVLPRPLSAGGSPARIEIVGPDAARPDRPARPGGVRSRGAMPRTSSGGAFRHASFAGMAGDLVERIAGPYALAGTPAGPREHPAPAGDRTAVAPAAATPPPSSPALPVARPPGRVAPILQMPTAGGDDYAGDLMGVIRRYADFCVELAGSRGDRPEVVHAHDWMTYLAGIAVSRTLGVPLVVHVHSTEYDRSGESVHPEIHDVERTGMHAADRVITVSRFTANIVRTRYGVPEGRIRVVHNGVALPPSRPARPQRPAPSIAEDAPRRAQRADAAPPSVAPSATARRSRRSPAVETDPAVGAMRDTLVRAPDGRTYRVAAPRRRRPTVLYFGRITRQKGPEFFVRAAARVLEKVPEATFVVAGSGDRAPAMVEQAASLGLGSRMRFAGFLRGPQIEQAFAMADLYVMPSVSEPFGIAPLEALAHGVPVLISRTSGVSEVLENALKVDFWDVDAMADRMVAVLRHRVLADALREHGEREARGISWSDAAAKCDAIYREAARAA